MPYRHQGGASRELAQRHSGGASARTGPLMWGPVVRVECGGTAYRGVRRSLGVSTPALTRPIVTSVS